MDRNSIIGFGLIALLLFVYFTWFGPSPELVKQPLAADSLKTEVAKTIAEPASTPQDTLFVQSNDIKEEEIVIENDDIKLTLSNKGAIIRTAELKKYKTYTQKPLLLVEQTRSRFTLEGNFKGTTVNLYQPMYRVNKSTVGDSTRVEFVTSSEITGEIRHIYTLAKSGYEVKYYVSAVGASGESLTFNWYNRLPLVEKDINDSRAKSTLNYYSTAGDFDYISESSQDEETLDAPASKWVASKQKFFVSGFLTKNTFTSGKLNTKVDIADSSTVKITEFNVKIPVSDVTSGKGNFSFYLGPNDYKTLESVAPGFRQNVDLGWRPVKWVNQFLIVPVFQILTKYFSNYAVIIILMVFLIRGILFPLSYKSYLGMAKMRLLKPELDELKKKHEGDQVKFSQEQMKLFNEAGASPFSGCIPLLLQMPFLFAMFFLFPACIEFRQQVLPFVEDISTYDSVISFGFSIPLLGSHLSIYTLLMTASTLVITWQNNQISTVDGPMKSMGYIMPVIFLFVLNTFPASLNFYYLVSNVVSFAQQTLIKRFVDEEKIKKVMDDNRKKRTAEGSTKSSFMSRLGDAMKASEEARKKNKR
jgi:YidC/Oxa1 family membrane protein insertase